MFDSGFGGLSVARSLIDLLPEENLVYLGDTARYPYGPRDAEEVRGFALELAAHLVERANCKVVVVACNTAASVALEAIAARVDVPVIGVLEPGMRAATAATRNGVVGVIGTVGTVASGAYQRLSEVMAPATRVLCAACPGFVEFVERGETMSDQVHVLAERLLAPLKTAGVDTLLLGCTHYPFLARTIGDVMGPGVVLVSSADETAFDTMALLERDGLRRRGTSPGTHHFYSSGSLEWFTQMGRRLLGPELGSARPLALGSDGAPW